MIVEDGFELFGGRVTLSYGGNGFVSQLDMEAVRLEKVTKYDVGHRGRGGGGVHVKMMGGDFIIVF